MEEVVIVHRQVETEGSRVNTCMEYLFQWEDAPLLANIFHGFNYLSCPTQWPPPSSSSHFLDLSLALLHSTSLYLFLSHQFTPLSSMSILAMHSSNINSLNTKHGGGHIARTRQSTNECKLWHNVIIIGDCNEENTFAVSNEQWMFEDNGRREAFPWYQPQQPLQWPNMYITEVKSKTRRVI